MATPNLSLAEEIASKLNFKLMNGMLKNKGTLGGATNTYGELDFAYEKFLVSDFSLGLGYHLDLDYSHGRVPFKGANLFARYYFGRPGSAVKVEQTEIDSDTRSRWVYFVGLDFQQRDYFLGSVPLETASAAANESETTTTSSQPFSGNFFSTSATVGFGLLIAKRWQGTVEGSFGLRTFAASDDRMSILANYFSLGVSYFW